MSISTHNTGATKEAHDFLMTETGAANVLGLKPGTLRHWRTTGRVGQPTFVKLNRAVRYRSSDIAAYIDSLTAGEEL